MDREDSNALELFWEIQRSSGAKGLNDDVLYKVVVTNP